MKSVLLVTSSNSTPRLLADALGPQTSVVLLPPPAELRREKFDELFATWLGIVDAVMLDGESLGETIRWALESLVARSVEHLAVAVRFTAPQQSLYTVPPGWLTFLDTDPPDQVQRSLIRFFERHEAQSKVKRLEAVLARVAATKPRGALAAAPVPPAADVAYLTHRYRDALKNISLLLSQRHDQAGLLQEFTRLLRELLGIQLALFLRVGTADRLTLACSVGIKQEVVARVGLGLESGIGGALAQEGKILRRELFGDPLALDYDPQIAREFEWLGAEVAVPMIDSDELRGVLLFGGKITGEDLATEELELIYHLLTQLGQALRHLELLDQVEAQRRLLSEILANVQSGVLVVGADRGILHVNRRARELLELGPAELIGQDISRIPGRVADVIFETLQTGREVRQREVMLLRQQRPLAVSASPFTPTNLSGTGTALGPVAVALLDDLTQVKRQQAQARELADREFFMRLTERMEHELKNALTPIQTFAQLLPTQANDKEFQDRMSATVPHQVHRVVVLLNNLKFFGQPLKLNYEDLTLSELIEACLKNLAEEFGPELGKIILNAGEKSPATVAATQVITVKRNFAHKITGVAGDKIRLRQAFEHLLRNAVQAMPEGGRLLISTADALPADFPGGAVPEGGAVRIEFQDTGEGIALESLARVTAPFVTTRNTGVGLGLTIVKRIVERHSGRLNIDSMLGRGTTVAVVLPARMQPHPEDSLLAEAEAVADQTELAGMDARDTEPHRLAATERRGRAEN